MAHLWRQSYVHRSQGITALWFWYAVALFGHTGWGIYPALGRYMQTVSGLPSMSILVMGALPMTVLLLVYVLPRYGWRIYVSRTLWIFAVVTVARAVTNILAQRYTLAIYVQLMALLTPFIVVFLSRAFLREPIPRFTVPAILLSTLGALLMLSRGAALAELSLGWTPAELLGLGLALASAFFLALYMLMVRRTAQSNIPGLAVLVFQTVVIQVSALLLSGLAGEQWSAWLVLDMRGWGVFLGYVVLVIIGANAAQIGAIRHLGAPFVSSLMGWRLVGTLLVSMLLLNEGLTSIWQGVGMVIVIATVTWYLWQQRTG